MDETRFDGTEIDRQARRIEEETDQFSYCSNEVIKLLGDISDSIKSQDSSLQTRIDDIQRSYITLREKVNNNYSALAARMKDWAAKTIEAEQRAAERVESVSSDVESLNQSLDSIADL